MCGADILAYFCHKLFESEETAQMAEATDQVGGIELNTMFQVPCRREKPAHNKVEASPYHQAFAVTRPLSTADFEDSDDEDNDSILSTDDMVIEQEGAEDDTSISPLFLSPVEGHCEIGDCDILEEFIGCGAAANSNAIAFGECHRSSAKAKEGFAAFWSRREVPQEQELLIAQQQIVESILRQIADQHL